MDLSLVNLECIKENTLRVIKDIINDPSKLFASTPRPLTEWADKDELKIFSMRDSLSWNDEHWQIPVVFLFLYLFMLAFLPLFLKNKKPYRLEWIMFCWNICLSLFSFAGVIAVIPRLFFSPLAGLFTQGYYQSVCSHADWFGNGYSGLFLFLFVYSKIPELVDTLWLVLKKIKPSFLHWYHHCTVLMYAFQTSKTSSSCGIWFCAMNYFVHSIMYGYYAITQTKWKNCIKRFGIFITICQILQMFMGLFVLLSVMYYKKQGRECLTANSSIFFGLLIYASYAILFIKFFIQRWICPKFKNKQA